MFLSLIDAGSIQPPAQFAFLLSGTQLLYTDTINYLGLVCANAFSLNVAANAA